MWCHMGQSRDTLHLPKISSPNVRKVCWSDGSYTSRLESFFDLFVSFFLNTFSLLVGARSLVFFLFVRVFIYVFVAINIVQQSRGPSSPVFCCSILCGYCPVFCCSILCGYCPGFLCWSLMDHHANVLSPISISLWMLLSIRYEGMLCMFHKFVCSIFRCTKCTKLG